MPRKVPFTVVYHLEMELPDDYPDHTARFFIEENHCLDNHTRTLRELATAEPNVCGTCNIGNAYLGHIPFALIVEAQEKHEAASVAPSGQSS